MIRTADARRTATIIAVLTMLMSFLLLVVVALSGLSMNRAAQKAEEHIVSRELDRLVVRVLDEQKSVALWDEAIVRIGTGDRDWLHEEIGGYLNRSYSHDEVYILNGDDHLVYAYPVNRNIAKTWEENRPIAASLLQEIRTGRRIPTMNVRDHGFQPTYGVISAIRAEKKLRWSAHLMNLSGQPAIVSAMTVVPTSVGVINAGRPPVIISIIRLNAARLAAMGQAVSISNLHLAESDDSSNADGVIGLAADDGASIGVLHWKPSHPGRKLLLYILPLLILGTAWAVYASVALLRRLTRLSLDLEKSEREAVRLSYYDLLSDLPNRHKFILSLNEKLASWQKGEGERPLVAYIDLDRFKEVNDTLGHETGDALIRAVGQRLGGVLPEGNLLARLGGDEFAVMMPATDPLAGWKLGRELSAAFAEPVQAGDHVVAIAASIGIVIPNSMRTNSVQLMCEADIALYRAKEAGRGRAVVFRAEMAEAVERRRQTELDLRAAMTDGQLRLVYQPVLTIEGVPQFNSVEALLRWEHPTRGLVSPDEFIPIAETSGQMPMLGEWVITQALKDIVRWPGLQVAINLSPVQLKADGFARRVGRMVADAHIRPSQIIFEVTENVMMDASGHAGQALKDLRELGFRIALDDFGTGYSSLSYLRRFQFDRLKIDRSFIEGVEKDPEAVAVIEMVVALGRRLGLEVVAEGVENEMQARLMKQVGCTHLQGWFVARPLEIGGVMQMLDMAPRGEPIVQMLKGVARSA